MTDSHDFSSNYHFWVPIQDNTGYKYWRCGTCGFKQRAYTESAPDVYQSVPVAAAKVDGFDTEEVLRLSCFEYLAYKVHISEK